MFSLFCEAGLLWDAFITPLVQRLASASVQLLYFMLYCSRRYTIHNTTHINNLRMSHFTAVTAECTLSCDNSEEDSLINFNWQTNNFLEFYK